MAEQKGYIAIAEVKINGNYSYCAIYDDGYKYAVGDEVMVTTAKQPRIAEIIQIIESTRLYFTYGKSYTLEYEVIGKVDITAYKERLKKRKEIKDIETKMDRIVKDMDKKKYEFFAKHNPELAELLARYEELTKEKE